MSKVKLSSLFVFCVATLATSARAEGVLTYGGLVVEGPVRRCSDCSAVVESPIYGIMVIPCDKVKAVIPRDQTLNDVLAQLRCEEEAARQRAEPRRLVPAIPAAPRAVPTPPGVVPAAPAPNAAPKAVPPAIPAPAKPSATPAPATPAPATPAAPAIPAPPTPAPPGTAMAALDQLVANEAAAVNACRLYNQAQTRYHQKDWNGDNVLEYAQALKGDFSLLETKAGAADVHLIEPNMAAAEGDPVPGSASLSGYRFKVLKGQGENAFGGKRSYISAVNGKERMTLGYALVAYPDEYGKSGRYTFQISNAGVIWKKDLGAQTHEFVKQMQEFNPDKTWLMVE
ncbi:MAG TPA: DUF2950 family protein [Planctomycetota bacterium]|jgi:hypothetical protein